MEWVKRLLYVLTNDGKVKLYLKGGVAYVADLGKGEMDSSTTVYAFASFSHDPIASSYNPDCGEIKEYRWTVFYTQNHTLTNLGNAARMMKEIPTAQ